MGSITLYKNITIRERISRKICALSEGLTICDFQFLIPGPIRFVENRKLEIREKGLNDG